MRLQRAPIAMPTMLFLFILVSLATASPARALTVEERVDARALIEGVYASERAPRFLGPVKSAWSPAPPSEAEIRHAIENHLKMADALEKVWGQRVDLSDLQAEYDRILANTHDQKMLVRILDVLDRDPETIAACLIEPIVVHRRIHREYWWDDRIHDAVRQTALAELELLSGEDGDHADLAAARRTVTEWRRATEDQPSGVDIVDGIQVRWLNPAQWQQLLDSLDENWHTADAPGTRLPIQRFSPLEESREYLATSVVLDRRPTAIRIATYTWWKQTFSDWWAEHGDGFTSRSVNTDLAISLDRSPASEPRPPKVEDRSVAADAWYSLDTSDPAAPVARDQHTVVWTGTHMIVWGGTNGAQVFNSGGIYDPATDSWTATAQGPRCPSGRFGHTMTWTQDRVFVWGGWDGSTNENTGSKYNPVTDYWARLPVDTGTPFARHHHAAMDDGWLYIWGGRTATALTATGSRYAFTLDQWSTSSDPTTYTPSPRERFVTVDDAETGRYYIWGGVDTSTYPTSGGMYDAAGIGWMDWNTSGAPSGRVGHTGVVTGTWPCGGSNPYTEVILWGGWSPFEPGFYTNTGAIDGYGGWRDTPTGSGIPTGRSDHTAVMAKERDVMIVWGGTTGSGETATGGLLDTCDDSWTATDVADPDAPSARALHTAVWTGTSMLVWGGSSGGTALDDGAVYTICDGSPSSAPAPDVADEDPCDVTGIRITWSSTPTWNDFDVHRRVAVLRDGAVLAEELLPADGSYLDTTAAEGQSYDYQVRFTNSCGLSSTSISVPGVDESSSTPSVSIVPTAVDADGCTSSSGIDISWPADPDSWGDGGHGERKYRVWRYQTPMSGWVALGDQLDYGTTTYHDPNPGFGQYYVKYINGCSENANSNPTELVYDLDGATPTVNQAATAADDDACTHSGNLVTWPANASNWGDGGTGDRYYRLRRSADGVTFNPIGSDISYGTTSFVDATATGDQQYHYQVRYTNGCDLVADSASDTATDLEGETPVTGFNASASDPDTCDDGGVVVTWPQDGAHWGDHDSGTRTYEVLRGGTTIQTGIAYGTTTYTDTGADNGVLAAYRVRMVNGCGLSAESGVSDSVADLPATPVIQGAAATATDLDPCDGSGVQVTWSADPGGGWGDDGGSTRSYSVLRDGAVIQSGIAYGTTEFTDTTAPVGTDSEYSVRYVNCGGEAAETAGVTAADHAASQPTIDTNNTAQDTDTCTDEGVTVTWPADPADWADNDHGTRTYDVLRDATPIQTGIAYGTTSFVDTTGDNGTGYIYQVRYNNGCGLTRTTGGESGKDRPVTPAAAANNTAADLDACASTGVQVSWAADPDGNWGDGGVAHTYDVLRDGAVLASGLTHGTTTYTDTAATPGVSATYSVRYVNCGGLFSETTGASAADANGTPATPAAPSVRDASPCAQDGVWITWDSVAGAASYELRIDGSTEITAVTQPLRYDPGDSASHTYEVRAMGASCSGDWSPAATLADIIDPDALFCDGFEAGTTDGWSATVPAP